MDVDVIASGGSFALLVAGTGLALVVSFFCSLMEAALLSITPGQLARLKREKPRLGSVMADLKKDMDRSITAILTLNTTAHTVGATIAGAEFALMFGDQTIGVFSGIFTFLMLQYTEVLPKSLGVRFNRVICAWMSFPLSVLTRVMGPLIRLLRLLNRPFESRSDTSVTSLEEVVALAKHARLLHQITTEQETINTQAACLSEMAASDIMVPVEQITFLSSHQTLSSALVTAHMDPHTRFPVIKNDARDEVQGYINFKELVYRLRTNPGEPTLQGVIRPVRFVLADMPCQQKLRVEHLELTVRRIRRSKPFEVLIAPVSLPPGS
jgi:CBS domain containing-hemolysin-like protein